MTTIEAEKILGLNGGYDKEILKSTHKNKLKKYHPDNAKMNGLTEEEAIIKSQMINEAFNILDKITSSKVYSNINNKPNYKSKDGEFVDVSEYTNAISSMLYQQVKSDSIVFKQLRTQFASFDNKIWEMCYSYIDSLHSQIKYFNTTFGGNIDSIIKQNEAYITKRRELLYDINKLFWQNYYSTILQSFQLNGDFLDFIEKNDFFRDRINFVSLSTWSDDIFNAVQEVENAVRISYKQSALRKIKFVISSYSDRKHYNKLEAYLNNLGILFFNSLNLEEIPLKHINNFIAIKIEELKNEIEKTFINYTTFKVKEKISNFVFGDTNIVYVYDDKNEAYSYLKSKSRKRNFANVCNKDVSD